MSDADSPFDALWDANATPMERAQQAMRPALPKRFYREATVKEEADFFLITLDSRRAKTPGGKALGSKRRAIAERMATEWQALESEIDPARLPLTKLVNVALDRGGDARAELIQSTAAYGESDLICYRADNPEGLCEAQRSFWDPPLDWLKQAHGIHLSLAAGIMHTVQDAEALERLTALVERCGSDAEKLIALSLATTLTGSVALALYLAAGETDAATVWLAAHVDEDWNRKLWGEDAEASALRAARQRDFAAAAFVLAQD